MAIPRRQRRIQERTSHLGRVPLARSGSMPRKAGSSRIGCGRCRQRIGGQPVVGLLAPPDSATRRRGHSTGRSRDGPVQLRTTKPSSASAVGLELHSNSAALLPLRLAVQGLGQEVDQNQRVDRGGVPVTVHVEESRANVTDGQASTTMQIQVIDNLQDVVGRDE